MVHAARTPDITLDPMSGEGPGPKTFTGSLTDPVTGNGIDDRAIEFYVNDSKVGETTTAPDGIYSVIHTFPDPTEDDQTFTYYTKFPGDPGT